MKTNLIKSCIARPNLSEHFTAIALKKAWLWFFIFSCYNLSLCLREELIKKCKELQDSLYVWHRSTALWNTPPWVIVAGPSGGPGEHTDMVYNTFSLLKKVSCKRYFVKKSLSKRCIILPQRCVTECNNTSLQHLSDKFPIANLLSCVPYI